MRASLLVLRKEKREQRKSSLGARYRECDKGTSRGIESTQCQSHRDAESDVSILSPVSLEWYLPDFVLCLASFASRLLTVLLRHKFDMAQEDIAGCCTQDADPE